VHSQSCTASFTSSLDQKVCCDTKTKETAFWSPYLLKNQAMSTSSSLKWRGQRKNDTIPAHLNPKCSICRQGRGKRKVYPTTDHEGLEVEYRYSSTLSLTSALDGGGWSTPRLSCFTPRERPCVCCLGAWVGPRVGLDGCGKSCPPPGFNTQSIQPVVIRYTDWAIAAHCIVWEKETLQVQGRHSNKYFV
jgi:hypothetical protein